MNAESSRDPERNWHAFRVPSGMKTREALEYFERHVKPSHLKMMKYKYLPATGVFMALSESCQ